MILRTLTLAAALTALASPAVAQVDCGERPTAPTVPNGANASQQQMEATQRAVTAYVEKVNEYVQCLAREVDAVRGEGNRVTEAFTKAANDYNSGGAQ